MPSIANGRLSPIAISLSNFDTLSPPSISTLSESKEIYIPIHKHESFIGSESSSVSSSPATSFSDFEGHDGPTVYSVDDLILLSSSPLVLLERKKFARLRSITTLTSLPTSAGNHSQKKRPKKQRGFLMPRPLSSSPSDSSNWRRWRS